MSELDHYDYTLPKELIAQEPCLRRDDARLLVVNRDAESIRHHHIRDLGEFLEPGDCLVLNNTKVVPARLIGRRTKTGGYWEGLFLQSDPETRLWRFMGKTRGKIRPEETVTLIDRDGEDAVLLHMGVKQPDGTWVGRIESDEDPFALLANIGRVPLPPYIRKGQMVDSDAVTYQTVFAEQPGAVAAPTAGLHFTEHLLHELQNAGVLLATVTLHVGLGTFEPIAVDSLADHKMHSEWGSVEPETVDTIRRVKQHGKRVVAVGTTSMRILETAAVGGTQIIEPFAGETDLFIRPPLPVQSGRRPHHQLPPPKNNPPRPRPNLRRRRTHQKSLPTSRPRTIPILQLRRWNADSLVFGELGSLRRFFLLPSALAFSLQPSAFSLQP